MTAINLDAAREKARETQERASKATPGPCHINRVDGYGGNIAYQIQTEQGDCVVLCSSNDLDNRRAKQDIAAMFAARSDAPELAALVLAMADEIEELRKGLAVESKGHAACWDALGDCVIMTEIESTLAGAVRRVCRVANLQAKEIERLCVIAAEDTPFPAVDVLRKLADYADHTFDAHNCDHLGYETVMAARDAARRIAG